MQITRFKPALELQHDLQGRQRIALMACTVCANLCQTGGHQGLAFMQAQLESWGREVVMARCITGFCAETIVREAFRAWPLAGKCDALMVLSCAGGVKTAWLCQPGVPIITALDSLGSGPVTRRTNAINATPCHGCSHCVISYTAGICPLSGCPRQRHYRPCDQAPLSGPDRHCRTDATRDCIWRTIADEGGDLAMVAALEDPEEQRMEVPWGTGRPMPGLITRPIGQVMARSGGLVSRFIPLYD